MTMVKSMTGFGRSEYTDGKRNITVEIRSVNHRYGDISVKMPRRYSFAEDSVKKAVKATVHRGKAEVFISVENTGEEDVSIILNTALAQQYLHSLRELQEISGAQGNISPEYLASLPDVMKSVPDTGKEDEITQALAEAAETAVLRHTQMRAAEGEKLAEDILKRASLIDELVNRVEERSPDVVREYAEKLRVRIAELTDGVLEGAEEKILLEAALFADKINVTEEVVRLRSHTGQLRKIIADSSQPQGKKLDFLVQEMNREANTIGSKANDLEITSCVLEIKSEIEKIREQVQNIE